MTTEIAPDRLKGEAGQIRRIARSRALRAGALAALTFAPLFAGAQPASPFDGRWATTLVCEDVKDKGTFVKGYTFEFMVSVKNGQLDGQYGRKDGPASVTYAGKVQDDGTVDIVATGVTGNSDANMGRVARGENYSYRMHGKFGESNGRASRTTLRPCEATFTKQ